jgi:hypothetical protein
MTHQQGGDAGFGVLALETAFGEFKAGDVFHCLNNFPFLKTENGWIVQKPSTADQTCTKQSPKDVSGAGSPAPAAANAPPAPAFTNIPPPPPPPQRPRYSFRDLSDYEVPAWPMRPFYQSP